MEKSAVFDKENVIGPISCSPVLPSVQERIYNTGAKRQSTSPLSVLRDSQQDNTFDSPGRGNSHKVAQFLSTPLRASPDCKTPTNSWEEIRKLDEEELWIERTQVVTKEEHILYCEVAKEIVNNIMENLPINSMENNHDNNDEPTDSGLAESLDETVVSEEKEENVATEIKTIALDIESLQLPEQPLEKSVFEDNDFIHSCTDLDTTVKEVLNDEADPPTLLVAEESEDVLADDFNSDAEKTICPDEDEVNDLDPELHTQDVADPVCDNDVSEIQLDEDSFTSSKAFALELDYLETVGNSDDGEHMNDLARQSLYVKFDPLVQAVKNGGLKEGPSNLANLDPAGFLFPSSISGSDLLVMDTPPNKATQSRVPLVSEFSNEEQNSSKISSATTPVDQLFDFSPTAKFAPKPETEESRKHINGNVTEEDSSLVQLLQYSKDDLEKAVAEEREKLLTQWKTQTDLHELEIKDQAKKMEILLVGKTKAENDVDEMKVVMHEYEQTMSQIIEERDRNEQQHEKSTMEVIQERDQLHHDLNNTEKSFAHLHARCEKLKTAVEVYKKNEETLKKVVSGLQEDLHKTEGKYQLLKKHAEKKIEEANVEITRVQTALQAALKRERAKNSSLQQNLDQKISENDELTAICDELISKVGPVSSIS